jgi:putative tryptophan/tyrosine transport system substrate-binding protein
LVVAGYFDSLGVLVAGQQERDMRTLRRICANLRTIFRVLTLVACVLFAVQPAAAVDAVGRVYKLGFLGQTSSADLTRQIDALRQGLRDLGYEEGRNLIIEYRWAERRLERLPSLATQLVELKVDVIVTHGSAGSRAAKQATETVPIVIAVIGDPVANGLVASMSRPGGNVTGLVLEEFETTVKWLELLKQTVPTISRIGVLEVPGIETPQAAEATRQKEDDAAHSRGLELQRVVVRGADDIPQAFANLAERGAHAVVVPNSSLLNPLGATIASIAVKHQLLTIGSPAFARVGGLVGYGPDGADMYRRAAGYIDRILRGAQPKDLPMEGPPKFELAFNLRTARALGLIIPTMLLAQADQRIE